MNIKEEPTGSAWLAAQLTGGRVSGDGYLACCPAHDDEHPSLSICDGENGKVLVHCRAGCAQSKVIRALTRSNLWPVPNYPSTTMRTSLADSSTPISVAPRDLGRPNFERLCGVKPFDIYDYRNSKGEILGYVCRLHLKDGSKSFRPITPWRNRAGKVRWQVKGFSKPNPLFGLVQLAKRHDAPVLVVEGEKTAAEAMDKLSDYVVVTWPGGTNAVKHADWSPLKGRDVLIWPDNDEPGRNAASEIAKQLRAARAAHVRVIELPEGLPEGWDLADPTPKGFSPRTLMRSPGTSPGLAAFLLSASELSKLDIPPREMIISPFLPTNSINLLFAVRGTGKTWVSLTAAIAVAQGTRFLGFEVPKARHVLFVDGEMPLADLKKRIMDLGGTDIEGLDILPSETLFREDQQLNINQPSDQNRIDEMLLHMQGEGRMPSLIIFDNLSALRVGADENDNTALDSLLQWFLRLRHRGFAILLIHHAGKSGEQRGASRLEDLLDTSIKLEQVGAKPQVGASFDLSFTKTRGEVPQPSRVRLKLISGRNGLLVWEIGASEKEEAWDKTLQAVFLGPAGDGSKLFRQQKDVAESLKVRKSTISKHFAVLSQKGYIDADARDITVTDAGVERLRLVYPDEDFG